MRPSRLGDDDLLTRIAHGGGNAADLALDPRARTVGLDGGIEERMRIRGAVIRRLAQFRMRDQRVEGVDRDDGAGESGFSEDVARGAEGGDDFGDAGFAHVDELVADGDGGDDARGEVAVQLADQAGEVGGDVGDGEEAGEDFDAFARGGFGDGGDLVAVHAVDADGAVGGEGVEVRVDLVLRFAGSVAVVGGVADAEAGGEWSVGLVRAASPSRAGASSGGEGAS